MCRNLPDMGVFFVGFPVTATQQKHPQEKTRTNGVVTRIHHTNRRARQARRSKQALHASCKGDGTLSPRNHEQGTNPLAIPLQRPDQSKRLPTKHTIPQELSPQKKGPQSANRKGFIHPPESFFEQILRGLLPFFQDRWVSCK